MPEVALGREEKTERRRSVLLAPCLCDLEWVWQKVTSDWLQLIIADKMELVARTQLCIRGRV